VKLGHASLNRRLLVGAAVFIALALVAAAIVIGFVLHRFVQGQIDQRLDTQIVFLSSMLAARDDGIITLAGNADGPPFDRPARGWYWEVVGPGNVLRSRSLEGASIDVPEFHRRPREGRPAPAEGPRQSDDTVIPCGEHRGQKDDLRIEPLIDLTLDEAMEDKANDDRSSDKRQRDENRGADQEPSVERGMSEFHGLPDVRRYPRPRTVSIIS
jgi:hypothetical protein